MTSVLTLQNNALAPAGLIGDMLDEAGIAQRRVRPLIGEAIPESPDGFDGLLVLGGAMNALDDAAFPFLAEATRLIRAFLADGRPVLGICLGSQLLAWACGATVRKNPEPEIGFIPLTSLPSAAADPLLGAVTPLPTLMQWHFDTFDLPGGAELLAESATCRNQAFRVGPAQYGLQFHLEVNAGIVEDWVADGRDFLAREHPDILATIATQQATHLAAAEAAGRAIGRRWAAMVAAAA